MDHDLAGRIAFLEGQVLALNSLILAQSAVLEQFLPGSAAATAKVADLKRRAALHSGQVVWAETIECFVDQLRERFNLPVNDGQDL